MESAKYVNYIHIYGFLYKFLKSILKRGENCKGKDWEGEYWHFGDEC